MKKSAFLAILLIFALPMPLRAAKILFHAPLEDEASVKKQGGEVKGKTGYFAPCIIGNGYCAPKVGDVILFPVDGRINKEHGTCEFFVKTVIPYSKVPSRANEVFLMTCAFGDNRFFVQSHFQSGGPGISWRVNVNKVWLKDLTVDEYGGKKVTDWGKDEIHHIAGMYGEKGFRLYLDGILAGENNLKSSLVGGLPTTWAISNEEGATLPSEWIVDEFKVWDDYLTTEEVNGIIKGAQSVEKNNNLSTTWGRLKAQ